MSMSLEHRLQILIDDERRRRVVDAANERGVPVAATRLLAAPDMYVPSPAGLRAELDELRGRHA